MRVIVKWLLRIVLALVLAVLVVGFWKREEIGRLLAANSVFDEDKIVANFSNMNAAFLSTPLPRGNGPTSELTYGAEFELPQGADQWLEARTATSLLVLKDGDIRYEQYFLDTSPEGQRISWSVAKSYLSALFGILLEDGAITSLDDPVIKYAPQLKGSAYEAATIRNVLNMASGVVFDEDYFDYNSDINRMGRVLALGGKMDDFAASLSETFAEPGETWQYVSIDTHVISMVIRGATGRSIPELLTEKIIEPLGLERDGYYLTDGVGVAFVLGGLNFTTRDFARFGQMILQDGTFEGKQIVPAGWIADSTAASAPTKAGQSGYGYQWWIPADAKEGEFFGRGIYGQYLYFDKPRDVLIVMTAADRGFRDKGVHQSNLEMFRQIAQNL
ncbi:serine hydrolase [Ruegeria sp. 2205SS24-7]|uniref:serine hydrolase domain-containing protein n=1 Tax=Ruegeria discodermiae TaxID=3064389 RepID=UPI0027425D68|nr:serine hydrolase [Ruegeria sp. 2205SS24-7]MDP5218642.1 serine hydrolase [Ruegeria sp. 2205SS24-7]